MNIPSMRCLSPTSALRLLESPPTPLGAAISGDVRRFLRPRPPAAEPQGPRQRDQLSAPHQKRLLREAGCGWDGSAGWAAGFVRLESSETVLSSSRTSSSRSSRVGRRLRSEAISRATSMPSASKTVLSDSNLRAHSSDSSLQRSRQGNVEDEIRARNDCDDSSCATKNCHMNQHETEKGADRRLQQWRWMAMTCSLRMHCLRLRFHRIQQEMAEIPENWSPEVTPPLQKSGLGPSRLRLKLQRAVRTAATYKSESNVRNLEALQNSFMHPMDGYRQEIRALQVAANDALSRLSASSAAVLDSASVLECNTESHTNQDKKRPPALSQLTGVRVRRPSKSGASSSPSAHRPGPRHVLTSSVVSPWTKKVLPFHGDGTETAANGGQVNEDGALAGLGNALPPSPTPAFTSPQVRYLPGVGKRMVRYLISRSPRSRCRPQGAHAR